MPIPLLALLGMGSAGGAAAGAGAGAAGAGAAGAGAGAAGAGAGAAGAGAAGAGAAGAGAAGAGAAGAGAGAAGASTAGLMSAAEGLGAAGSAKAPSLLGSMLAMGGGKGAAMNPKSATMLESLSQNTRSNPMGGMASQVLQPPPQMAAPAAVPQGMGHLPQQPGISPQDKMIYSEQAPASRSEMLSKLSEGLGGPQGLMQIAGRTKSTHKPAPGLPFGMQAPQQFGLNPWEIRTAPSRENFGMGGRLDRMRRRG